MSLKEDLINIAGADCVIDDPAQMMPYITNNNLWPPKMANYVVSAKTIDDVQKVIQLANKEKVALKLSSSAVHTKETGPNCGGIILDLSQMKQISKIDNRNRKVTVEPGVTWGELTAALKKEKMRTVMPLLPHENSSVLVSCLERDPWVIPMFEYGEVILSMQMIWPTGELFRTGSASTVGFGEEGNFAEGCFPYGPGPIDAMRLMMGAQGTMGTAIWANIKTERLPEENKTFFIPFERCEDIVETIYAIQRKRIGHECLALSDLNLASILADTPEDIEALRKELPPWSLILIFSGAKWFPKDKFAYEKEVLFEAREHVFPFTEIMDVIPGYGSVNGLPELLRNPWPSDKTYWKDKLKGASLDLFFITTMDKTPVFTEVVQQIATEKGMNIKDIGMYIQPIEYGAGSHMEFNFFYNPENADECDTVKAVYAEAIEETLKMEAHYTRPYGKVMSDIVYEKTGSYTMLTKKAKEIFDPNNIMNPGVLCF